LAAERNSVGYRIPKDLMDVTDYLIGPDSLCDNYELVDMVKAAIKGMTIGEAVKKLEEPELWKKVRIIIQMPTPRKPPWSRCPVIWVRERESDE